MGYLLGFRTGTLVRVISEAHSVRTKPEVNLGGYGASHDPVGGIYTCFLFNLAPKMEDLLWEIDHYHSDVTVLETQKKMGKSRFFSIHLPTKI